MIFYLSNLGQKLFFKPYVNAKDFINGGHRWILSLHGISPNELRKLPKILKLVKSVKEFRLKSSSLATKKLAETPTLYHLNVIPNKPFLVIPSISSENRKYVPIGYMKPPVINANMIVENANVSLISNMHML